jgi:peptide/nickel transport system ATP-binding protein
MASLGAAPLLDVRDLTVRFRTESGLVRAVEGISYTLHRGEALGLVGESGSGKSASALALLRLLSEPPAEVSGSVVLAGRDLLVLPEEKLRGVRGREVGFIFQDPGAALNPVLSVGEQVAEGLRVHKRMGRAARGRAAELLAAVGIPLVSDRVEAYPHELSGGQRQRVLIAVALACEPALLIADEPTTALDVTIQAQIVDLVERLRRERGMALLWITHDLPLAASLVDRIAVMYAGHLVELGPVDAILDRPRHPYSRGLLRAMPGLEEGAVEDPGGSRGGSQRLEAIPGSAPDLRTGSSSRAPCPIPRTCPPAAAFTRAVPSRPKCADGRTRSRATSGPPASRRWWLATMRISGPDPESSPFALEVRHPPAPRREPPSRWAAAVRAPSALASRRRRRRQEPSGARERRRVRDCR